MIDSLERHCVKIRFLPFASILENWLASDRKDIRRIHRDVVLPDAVSCIDDDKTKFQFQTTYLQKIEQEGKLIIKRNLSDDFALILFSECPPY